MSGTDNRGPEWCDYSGCAKDECEHCVPASIPTPAAKGLSPYMEPEAVSTLTAEGWVWDGDQWVKPKLAAKGLSDEQIEQMFYATVSTTRLSNAEEIIAFEMFMKGASAAIAAVNNLPEPK